MTASTRLYNLLRFLLIECGLVRDPVLAYAVLASVSRSGLIIAVNHAVTNPGLRLGSLSLLALAVVATLLFVFLSKYRNHQVLERLLADMRLDMSRQLLDADVTYLQQRDHGEIQTAMTWHIREVSASSLTVVEAVEAILLLLIVVPYLFWVSWPIGIATMIAVCVGGLGFVFAQTPAQRLMVRAHRANASFHNLVSDMLAGWMELRLRRARRDELEADVAETVETARSLSVASERLFSVGNVVTQATLFALLCAIAVLLPALQGADTATMLQVLTVVLLTYGPVETVFGGLPRLSRASVSKERMDEVAHELARRRKRSVDAGERDRFARIELKGVTALLGGDAGVSKGRQQDDVFALGPIDLTLVPGEIVFICGGNGAGKTTLLSLLTGLRRPDSGEVLLDGRPVDLQSAGEYRSLFSAVFSQFHLFRKPYGLDGDEQEALRRLIGELGLADRVSLLEEQFSTLALSTGQKRRLAAAVALAESRPIIIFDEFAADQDPARRAFFYDTLVPRLADAGKLVVAVTHDEHRFSQCDRLIRMHAGRIVSDTRMERGRLGTEKQTAAPGHVERV